MSATEAGTAVPREHESSRPSAAVDEADGAPAFDGLVSALTSLCDRAFGPAVTVATLRGALGREQQELVVQRWVGAGFRSVRFAVLRGSAGTFALNACAFPEPDAALPVFSYEHLVLRHKLHLWAIDLLDTSLADGNWSRTELARVWPTLALPRTASLPAPLPAWTEGALSPEAILLRAPDPLPTDARAKAAALTMFAALLVCPRARTGAEPAGRAEAQNRFHDAMLAADPAVAYLRRAFGEPIEALATGVLFPRLP